MPFLFHKNQNVINTRRKLNSLNSAIREVYLPKKTDLIVLSDHIYSLQAKVKVLIDNKYLLESFVLDKKVRDDIKCAELIAVICAFCHEDIAKYLTEKNKNRRQFYDDTAKYILFVGWGVVIISSLLIFSSIIALAFTNNLALAIPLEISVYLVSGGMLSLFLGYGYYFFTNDLNLGKPFLKNDIEQLFGDSVTEITNIELITQETLYYEKLLKEFDNIEEPPKTRVCVDQPRS